MQIVAETGDMCSKRRIIATLPVWNESVRLKKAVNLVLQGITRITDNYLIVIALRRSILRFADIFRPRAKHGVIADFVDKLKSSPRRLEILGGGSRGESYLYIRDRLET